MTVDNSDQLHINDVNGHLEVVGASKEELEHALALIRADRHRKVAARAAFVSYVRKTMLDESAALISLASQKQIQRSAGLRQHLMEEEGFETYASLAATRSSQESSVRTWVSRMRKRNELFTVELNGATMIPKVQLTSSGNADPHVVELIRPLLRAGLDGWSLWAWLTQPNGLLSGEVPAEVVKTDAGRAARASDRYAAEIRRATEST
ncbi:DUF2384 domain-containing protein [Brevibacterium luteolum]|uniref:DUF2384 domain-containing protein n=1 Tax=Brevibacterium luteolum TaxID=199591 RepID=A0A6G8KXS0_9MICO|nr:DUF2384 domain-containing protein [Brevibacterium luteolum]QIN29385.1 DUF2384 domain-containing protein [Brevibacterium luteolum]